MVGFLKESLFGLARKNVSRSTPQQLRHSSLVKEIKSLNVLEEALTQAELALIRQNKGEVVVSKEQEILNFDCSANFMAKPLAEMKRAIIEEFKLDYGPPKLRAVVDNFPVTGTVRDLWQQIFDYCQSPRDSPLDKYEEALKVYNRRIRVLKACFKKELHFLKETPHF